MNFDVINLYEELGIDKDTLDLMISVLADDRRDAFFSYYGHDLERASVNENLSKAKKRKLVKAMKDIKKMKLEMYPGSKSDVETLIK
ncbi:MAG: hypothetical protein J6B89_00575 [Bacilli bacterium]|nr:hypothetical protein [Bacilli bacterium]